MTEEAGPQATGRPGRPRHHATDRVKELLAEKCSEREIVERLKEEDGISIHRATVGRIRSGARPVTIVHAGERKLPHPVRCPNCRDPLAVVPCRVCGATWPPELDDLNRVAERRALAISQQRPT